MRLPKIKILPFRNSKYLLPGLKRWIALLIIGVISIIFGVALVLELRPFSVISSLLWNSVRSIATFVPPHISGPLALVFGIGVIGAAVWFSIRTTLVATQDSSGENLEYGSIIKSLERSYRKGQGAKIVTIGGGTGLSALLRGLKNYSRNITAIVTVGDDGGSSGKLREELKVIPPGDIRNCIVALSDEFETLSNLFQYRFSEGSLKGHSLGNLFLAALFDICNNNMSQSTQLASRILRSSGRVLPSSDEPLYLCAEYHDGSEVCGESQIPNQNKQIKRIFNKNAELPKLLPAAVKAIRDAELIILGPGSLFTSVIPNLLFPDLVHEIKNSSAKVLYVCNLVQDRETEGYKVSDFVNAIHRHTGEKIIESILVNDPQSFDQDGSPIEVDLDHLYASSYEVIVRPKLHDDVGGHNSLRLARSIIQWLSLANKGK